MASKFVFDQLPTVKATMRLFLDDYHVMKKLKVAEQRLYAQSGAYVMKTARNLIKSQKGKKKKVSQPGQPPRSQTGLLKEHIYFAYDPGTGGLVIGPSKLNAKGTDVPRTLEEGGESEGVLPRNWNVTQEVADSLGIPESDRGYVTKEGRVFLKKEVRYKRRLAPRPYMSTAREKSEPKLMKMWEDSVKRANR